MTDERRATVAIAHTNEKHRSQERVLSLVREALDHRGGMARFVRPGHPALGDAQYEVWLALTPDLDSGQAFGSCRAGACGLGSDGCPDEKIGNLNIIRPSGGMDQVKFGKD